MPLHLWTATKVFGSPNAQPKLENAQAQTQTKRKLSTSQRPMTKFTEPKSKFHEDTRKPSSNFIDRGLLNQVMGHLEIDRLTSEKKDRCLALFTVLSNFFPGPVFGSAVIS